MLQLAYTSMAARVLTAADLESIATSSRRNNEALGMTGLLLFREGSFHAVLEGSARDVLRRMEVIITDDRHRDVRILHERETMSRRFGNWTFASLPQTSSGLSPFPARDEFMRVLSQRLR